MHASPGCVRHTSKDLTLRPSKSRSGYRCCLGPASLGTAWTFCAGDQVEQGGHFASELSVPASTARTTPSDPYRYVWPSVATHAWSAASRGACATSRCTFGGPGRVHTLGAGAVASPAGRSTTWDQDLTRQVREGSEDSGAREPGSLSGTPNARRRDRSTSLVGTGASSSASSRSRSSASSMS